MTMTQSFFSGLVYEGLPVAWSLTVEECFYLMAPVTFALLARFLGDAGARVEPVEVAEVAVADFGFGPWFVPLEQSTVRADVLAAVEFWQG